MASKNKDTNTKKATTKRKSSHASGEDSIQTSEAVRYISGLLLLIFAIVMIVSFTSALFTGKEDQGWVSGEPAANWFGGLGIWVSNVLMNDTFGVATYFVPIFMVAAMFRIFQIGHVHLFKWFFNCTISMVWISVAAAYLQSFVFGDYWVYLGGMHGRECVTYLKDNIGDVGLVLVLGITLILGILYFTNQTISTIRKAIAKAQQKAEELAAAKNAKKEEEVVSAECEEEKAEENEEEEKKDPLNESLSVLYGNHEDSGVTKPNENSDTATTIDFGTTSKEQGFLSTETLENTPMTVHVGDEEITDTVDGTNAAETTDETTAASSMNISENGSEDSSGEKVSIGTDEEKADLDDTRTLEPYDPKLDLENYRYPTIDLLKRYEVKSGVDMEEQRKNKDQILTVLKNFGVEISSIKATVGPTITLYEITPAPGVRISKIRNLEDDIALSLSALGIRIIAPIPGKGTIGIEVPNAKPQMVSMESIINSKKFQETEFELPMALGKTITNEIFMVDLAKMPHLLVAGATGQGKSVGLNAIITSLLYKKHPAELKLVMVDPKKVEFSVYNPIVNHFLAQVEGNEDTDEPIITDVNKVIQTLKSLCVEMDTRYDLLKKARARNIKEYNQKFKDRQLNPNNGHRFMPYIVVIIDEYGDLIMTAGKEIELPIARIAQLARAVGIHMIIATQRPTANIITGTIKANFPARMAFKVSQMIDSRTILDRPGANQLVGRGDMLFLSGNEPVRVQCAFVDTPEVENIASYIACQQSYNHPFPLPEVPMDGDDSEQPDVDLNHLDPMFEEVARLIVSTQQGSTSMIQRKFSIGYNRAGRLMDQMEVAGIVGPAHGSKPREVLCVSEEDLEFRLNNLR